jgi:hypothetical protein
MAVVFTQDISQTETLMAFNNNVIRFGTDSGLIPVDALISIGSFNAKIFPTPDNTFYYNLKDVAKSLVNTKNFADTTDLATDFTAPSDLTKAVQGIVFSGNLTIALTLSNGTQETATRSLRVLAGVEQLESYKQGQIFRGEKTVLLPLFPKTSDRFYARYFEGYPFDVSFMDTFAGNFELLNETNLLGEAFDSKGIVTRLVFSDGRSDESINDVLPISLGRNVLRWADQDIRLIIDKVDVCEGVYLKWLNPYGGWSYWLFPKFSQRNLNTRKIGELENDFDNLTDTQSPQISLGREGVERISLDSDLLTPEKFNLLSTIYTAPKIYLFTGEAFSQASVYDWIEVSITNTQHRTRNWKGQPINVTLDIELPKRYTQTL